MNFKFENDIVACNLNRPFENFNYLKEDVLYTYGNETRGEFYHQCSSEGWFGRKLTFLPYAVYGVVKAIYHVAKIIYGAVRCDKKYAKAHCYYVARDLQETCGWLATLVKDRWGQYYVQKGRFHQSCYGLVLESGKQHRNQIEKIRMSQSDDMQLSLAMKYLIVGNKDAAFNVMHARQIENGAVIKKATVLLMKIGLSYLEVDYEEKTLECIAKIARITFEAEKRTPGQEKQLQKMNENPKLGPVIDNFFFTVARACRVQFETDKSLKDENALINVVVEKSKDPKTLERFLALGLIQIKDSKKCLSPDYRKQMAAYLEQPC